MKIDITSNNELMIIPETDFEIMWLNQNFNSVYSNISTFIKTGLTKNDVICLKIVSERKF